MRDTCRSDFLSSVVGSRQENLKSSIGTYYSILQFFDVLKYNYWSQALDPEFLYGLWIAALIAPTAGFTTDGDAKDRL